MKLELTTDTAPTARRLTRPFSQLPFSGISASRTAAALESLRTQTHSLIDDTTHHLNTHLGSIADFASSVETVDADLEARLRP